MVTKFPARWFDENAASARQSGARWNVNPRVVEAMIMVETGGDNGLVGDGGRSAGIIHIMDVTSEYINSRHPGGFLNRLVPADAIEMGCFYLNDMTATYGAGGNYLKTTRGYNAGQHSWRPGFTLDYPAYAAAYLAMRVEDTRGDPAKARDYQEYKSALDAMLEDADELGRGAEFRNMVRDRILADGERSFGVRPNDKPILLRGYGLGYYITRPGEKNDWHGFRDRSIALLGSANDGRAATRGPAPDFGDGSGAHHTLAAPVFISAEQLVDRAESLAGSRDGDAAHRAILRDDDVVRAIQAKLGFTGRDLDGKWGAKTQAAYELFEASHATFNADGRVSAAEVGQMLTPNPVQESIAQDHRTIMNDPELVRIIQTRIGLSGRDLDGKWGPKTQAAYDAYEERTVGHNADHRVSHEELAQMRAPTSTPAPQQAPANPLAGGMWTGITGGGR